MDYKQEPYPGEFPTSQVVAELLGKTTNPSLDVIIQLQQWLQMTDPPGPWMSKGAVFCFDKHSGLEEPGGPRMSPPQELS